MAGEHGPVGADLEALASRVKQEWPDVEIVTSSRKSGGREITLCESLQAAGRLHGDRRASTTNRYVDLGEATLSHASERITIAIERKLRTIQWLPKVYSSKPSGPVPRRPVQEPYNDCGRVP